MSQSSTRGHTAAFRHAADAVVCVAALALIAASLAALAARLWWGFELFAHFRVQYVAAQLPLAVLLAMLRRRRFAAVVALAAVPNVLPLVPYLAPGAQAAASGRTLDVVAVNVEWRNPSAKGLLETLAAETPDVIVVVELTETWVERLRPLLEHYPYRVLAPERGAFGIGLLSRHPLEDARAFPLETTTAIEARVAAPGGPMRVIGVHLRPPVTKDDAAERRRQLERLAALSAQRSEPVAVCGDFNLTPYSPEFTGFVRRTGLRDSRAGRGPGFTWPTSLPILGIPIDHCLVSPEVGVARFRRLPAFGSDHYPIAVELFMEDEA